MPVAKKSRVEVAVFPVAGRGTRFLPATKASPKEMLPIVDKPLIQYAVEEALAAGARRLVFITGSSKRAIEDHFDSDGELEHLLLKQGKSDLLNMLKSVLPSYASCIYIRQPDTPCYAPSRPWGTRRSSCTWPTTSSMRPKPVCGR
jgi:UTP--glucose-1-phosphate uridylyltransferase